ncbi:Na+/H+ antiporter NhaC family protein [Secundilactobacillus collinoides]|uniref:Na+/H+ antiporter NhaC family protein n=1 Tax=Secundilactobacillus collinoides TaxID=33960 RepID=UPI0006D175EB|nr:Na+/H+ antiporter NhaC family protein [Secundilactobacillus collinoides]
MKQGSWLPILILGVLLSFIILIFCVIHNIALGYALALCWVIFMAIGKREYGLKTLLRFSWEGAKTSFGVLKTLILIGAVIGIWMASGTIATIVYDAFRITNPQTFILIAFVVCAGVSFIIGTSFGTISIVGLPLMLIAKSGDINLNIVAGAIMQACTSVTGVRRCHQVPVWWRPSPLPGCSAIFATCLRPRGLHCC